MPYRLDRSQQECFTNLLMHFHAFMGEFEKTFLQRISKESGAYCHAKLNLLKIQIVHTGLQQTH